MKNIKKTRVRILNERKRNTCRLLNANELFLKEENRNALIKAVVARGLKGRIHAIPMPSPSTRGRYCSNCGYYNGNIKSKFCIICEERL